ncbi:unnamed protein product [Bursaphelenchus xylophilus]|uniref:(pine wood nematode) hypothetical protein n=1 Tax=Bursaphelenchus xylophilus TaxID=6326 RepID=A0A1I7RXF0_BURXY|nr:unnamed protein product [Bursaphelenchus xylophilus]CAG9126343.1 unnamed protein product [Bursaphelenchus xylophilus]
MSRPYDLVLFGASGFTGEYVLETFVKSEYHKKHTLAIAGRNRSKLEKSLDKVANLTEQNLSHIPILIADSSDYQSLVAVTSQTKVVITVVGPYYQHGEKLIEACLEGQSSYVDISGEPMFTEDTKLKYGEQAKEKGVYIVSACGFDSIPCDLGIQRLKKEFPGTLAYVETVAQFNPGPHGYVLNHGTYDSFVLAMNGMAGNERKIKEIRRQIMPKKLEQTAHGPGKRCPVSKDQYTGKYVIPFPGSDINCSEMTQYYDAVENNKYPVKISTYFALPSGLAAIGIFPWLVTVFGLAQFGPTRKFLLNNPKLVTGGQFTKEGPTRQQITTSTITYYIYGTGWPENEPQPSKQPTLKLNGRVDGPDCAYIGTSGALLSAALTILEDKDVMPSTGGAYSPGWAFNNTRIWERLGKFGFTFRTF